MSEPISTSAETRSRRRKALLAGGAVLGLGAAATLAAWSDDVWVSGSFSAGKFNVQGAVDTAGASWNEYDTSVTAGTLGFTVNPTAMSPGQSVYAPLSLRVDPTASSYDADISLPNAPAGSATSNAANDAFFNNLKVTLYNVAPGSCNASGTTAAPTIAPFAGVALPTTSNSTMFTLNKNSTAYGVCFKVTLAAAAPSTVQGGTTGPLTWNFHATSVQS